MYHALIPISKRLIEEGLREDGLPWDFTTLGTVGSKARKTIRAKLIAKADGIWAGEPALAAAVLVSKDWEAPISIEPKIKDGTWVKKGQLVAEWSGSAASVLALERPTLNLVQFTSGIATQTAALTELLKESWKKKKLPEERIPRITATRKTLPSYRDLSLYGVLMGGGYCHRVSLSGGVLIKENHIAAAGGLVRSIEGARQIAPHGLKIEIEVKNAKELAEAVGAGAEVIMLDNFSPKQVVDAIQWISKSKSPETMIEVSGGINATNLADYATLGVHLISSGSLTHSVQALDISLLVDLK